MQMRFILAALAIAVLFSATLAAAEGPGFSFTQADGWRESWSAALDKKDAPPRPFTIDSAADGNGIGIAFREGSGERVASITAPRWRVGSPLACRLQRLRIAAVTDGPAELAPILVDLVGNRIRLTAKPVTGGAVTWELPHDVAMIERSAPPDNVFPISWSPGAVAKREIGVSAEAIRAGGDAPTGPLFLRDLRITTSAPGRVTVRLTGGQADDGEPGSWFLAEEPLWRFTRDECWRDVHNNDRTLYTVEQRADGVAYTFKPSTKAVTLKIMSPDFALNDASLGSAQRIVTEFTIEGDPASIGLSLGIVDRQHQVLGPPAPQWATGLNRLVWDGLQTVKSWGWKDGIPDYPLRLDDYTLVHRGSQVATTVVLHRALRSVWRQAVTTTAFETDRPHFIWAPGEAINARLSLRNLGPAPWAQRLSLSLLDDQEREIWTRPLQVNVPATTTTDFPLTIDNAKLPQGVYQLRWTSAETHGPLHGQALLTIAAAMDIPKAKDSEFLYGMDLGGTWEQEGLLDWADWCGVDLVRNAARDLNFREFDRAEVANSLAATGRHGLRSTIMMAPGTPWDPDKVKFQQQIDRYATWLTTLAQDCAGKVRWYEIGNEPSLRFFFRGPPADYITLYTAWRAAIRAGDPTAQVLNGGLAFAGQAGAAERAAEIVKRMPQDQIDLWAYHGHGEGAKAERLYYQMAKRMVDAAGGGDKPLVDTETGFQSTDPASWRLQARTVVQKLMFIQSTGKAPFVLFFCFQPGWEWGLLNSPCEAKPGALAHRTVVRFSRGLRGHPPLDLRGAPGEAYWMDDANGHALVTAWSDSGTFTRAIDFGSGASEIEVSDLFGNRLPAEIDGTVLRVTVGADPLYIRAKRVPGSAAPMVQQPALSLPSVLRVVPGAQASFALVARNPGPAPLTATVSIAPVGAAPIAAVQQQVTIAANGQTPVTVPLAVADRPVAWWPRAWTVFAPCDGAVDLARFTGTPTSLPTAGGGTAAPQAGFAVGDVLDLAPLGGGIAEHRQAFCFASVTAPADMTADIGVAADYWMELYVNGARVFSSLDAGNGGTYDVLAHAVHIQLKQGANLIAARIQSGSGGWKFISGGPEAVAAARRAQAGTRDALNVELRVGDRLLARESQDIEILSPIAPRPADAPWERMAPLGVLGHIENAFKAQPDQSRWYHGADDLSGRIWFCSESDGSLRIAVAVRDDVSRPGDAATVRLAGGVGWSVRQELTSGTPALSARRDEAARTTWYEGVVVNARSVFGARTAIALDVTVSDDDWGERKQQASLSGSDDPGAWFQTWLP